MTAGEFMERAELLEGLNSQHPSFSRYYPKCLKYMRDNTSELGAEYTNDMTGRLAAKLECPDSERVKAIQSVIHDLNVIYRAGEISLTRIPMKSYVYARKTAESFLEEIRPGGFFELSEDGLWVDRRRFERRLWELSQKLLKGDRFEYYAKFRNVLIICLMNGVLKPQHVARYRAAVELVEGQVEEVDEKLALLEEGEELSGRITKQVLLNLMDRGIEYSVWLNESGGKENTAVSEALWYQTNALSGEPLHDYVYSQAHGVDVLCFRRRSEIVAARTVAENILTIVSRELLLQTAMNPKDEILLYGLKYERDNALTVITRNLDLLYQHDIISLETLRKQEAAAKASL